MLLGVLSGCIMATKVTNVKPGVGWWIILPLTVWWIYLADHLIDGFRLKENTQNHRHLFFYQNRKIFVLILCLISLVRHKNPRSLNVVRVALRVCLKVDSLLTFESCPHNQTKGITNESI